jgi:nicotinate phosphoribosyltransferase
MQPIIIDIDDQDIYKKYMQYFFLKQNLGKTIVEYDFFNRGKTKFVKGFKTLLEDQIENMGRLRWHEYQLNHLKQKCPFLPESYTHDYLSTAKYNSNAVIVDQYHDELSIKIKDELHTAIDWEVPLMAIICELNNITKNRNPYYFEKRNKIYKEKYFAFERMKTKVSEFGTRRRASRIIQYESLFYFKQYAPNSLIGTSNISLGRELDLPLKGTITHEVYMIYAALYGIEVANQIVTEQWWDTFGNNISCVLPDTFTTPFFLKNFNPKYANYYTTSRQDSMNPKTYTDLFVKFYNSININSKNKSIIYSDNIKSIDTVKNIQLYTKQFINPGFGIGTWLSNDCGCEVLNIVIKVTGVYKQGNLIKCVKLSDIDEKITGDRATAYEYISKIKNNC